MSIAGRLLVVLLVGVAVAVAVQALGWRSGGRAPDDHASAVADHRVARPAPVAEPSRPSVEEQAVRLLLTWDARRARAYARGDEAALRGLYLPGSRAGAADVRLLEAYTARGLVVRGLRVQLLEVRARARGRDTLRLRVTGRVAAARAVPARAPGPGRLLPRDAPSTHLITLHLHEGRWRVGRVASG